MQLATHDNYVGSFCNRLWDTIVVMCLHACMHQLLQAGASLSMLQYIIWTILIKGHRLQGRSQSALSNVHKLVVVEFHCMLQLEPVGHQWPILSVLNIFR